MTSTNKNTLRDRLSRYRQISLSVVGRTSGRAISRPVWFVLEGNTLYLLPVAGSDTQWYQNVLKNPSITISARGVKGIVSATPIKQQKSVNSVVNRFRKKYGTEDVRKYYSKFDVAVSAEIK